MREKATSGSTGLIPVGFPMFSCGVLEDMRAQLAKRPGEMARSLRSSFSSLLGVASVVYLSLRDVADSLRRRLKTFERDVGIQLEWVQDCGDSVWLSSTEEGYSRQVLGMRYCAVVEEVSTWRRCFACRQGRASQCLFRGEEVAGRLRETGRGGDECLLVCRRVVTREEYAWAWSLVMSCMTVMFVADLAGCHEVVQLMWELLEARDSQLCFVFHRMWVEDGPGGRM